MEKAGWNRFVDSETELVIRNETTGEEIPWTQLTFEVQYNRLVVLVTV